MPCDLNSVNFCTQAGADEGRVQRRLRKLAVPEGDSALGEIIRGQFQGNLVARENTNTIAAQPAGQVSQNLAVVVQLDAEQSAGKLFQYRPGNFDAVLFAHKPPRSVF